jgi:hypothetical protein
MLSEEAFIGDGCCMLAFESAWLDATAFPISHEPQAVGTYELFTDLVSGLLRVQGRYRSVTAVAVAYLSTVLSVQRSCQNLEHEAEACPRR